MNPSAATLASLAAKVTDWTPTDAAIAAALNTPSITNPATRALLPAPFTSSQVLGELSPGSIANLTKVPYLPDIRDKIAANDVAGCTLYASILAGGSIIQPSELSAILGIITAVQPDPSYSAQISWAQANLGRPVDAADIAAARPSS